MSKNLLGTAGCFLIVFLGSCFCPGVLAGEDVMDLKDLCNNLAKYQRKTVTIKYLFTGLHEDSANQCSRLGMRKKNYGFLKGNLPVQNLGIAFAESRTGLKQFFGLLAKQVEKKGQEIEIKGQLTPIILKDLGRTNYLFMISVVHLPSEEAIKAIFNSIMSGKPTKLKSKSAIKSKLTFFNFLDSPIKVSCKWQVKPPWKATGKKMDKSVKFKLTKQKLKKIPASFKFQGKNPFPLPKLKTTIKISRPEKTIKKLISLNVDISDLIKKDKPKITVKTVVKAPNIDGDLSDECWKERESDLRDFVTLPLGNTPPDLAKSQTKIMLAYTADALYVAAVLSDDDLDNVKANCKGRDSNVFGDDCLETFITLDSGDKTNYYHIVINSVGAVYDAKCKMSDPEEIKFTCNKSWNSDVQVKAGKAENAWIIEAKFLFSKLGKKPAKGDKWRINFCRHRTGSPDEDRREYSAWGWLRKGFHDTVRMGVLTFD